MKKTTFLALLLVIPFLSIAQGPWEFATASADYTDWTKSACDDNQTDGVWELTTNGSNNPNITNETAGVDADANQYAAVTLRLSASGPTYMRLRIPKDDASGYVYKTTVLDPSQTGFVTYYINATDSNWSGTEDNIRFQFKDDNGSNGGANHTSTGETIEIERVEFVNAIPATVQNSYTFDSSEEGWDEVIRCSVVAIGGNLEVQLAGTGSPSNNSKVSLNPNYAINASGNAYFHIVMKNNSNDDQLKIVYPNTIDGGNVTVTELLSTNDASFVTYSINLGANPNWTGEINSVQLVFDDAGDQEGNGLFQIDSIVVDNNPTLALEQFDITSISIYPNPTNTILNIKGFENLSKVQLFDVLGKKVFEANELVNNQMNVASYNPGVYMLRLIDADNNVTIKRLIVK